MRSFFQPANGPTWLGQVLSSIRAALGDIWPGPLRLKDYATADLPAAADFSAGLVWDSTLLTFKVSDGTNWLRFAAYGSGVTSFNTRTGAVTLTSGDVTTALTYTPTSVTGLTGTQSVAAFKAGLSLVEGDITGLVGDLAAKAPLASPPLTGTPTAPTAANATSSTQLASTAFVHNVIADVINAAPAALDTLKELADAIGDDANYAATVTTNLATKLAKASNLSDLTNAATARTNLGLAIGTNVQAFSSVLTIWAGITPGANVGTFLATPSSANLAAALTDETGTGAAVFATNPTFADTTNSGKYLSTAAAGAPNFQANQTTGSISDSATFDFSSAQASGMFLITEVLNFGHQALCVLNGASVAIVWQDGSLFSSTINTAAHVNLYYNGSIPRIQNKAGAAASFSIINLKGSS